MLCSLFNQNKIDEDKIASYMNFINNCYLEGDLINSKNDDKLNKFIEVIKEAKTKNKSEDMKKIIDYHLEHYFEKFVIDYNFMSIIRMCYKSGINSSKIKYQEDLIKILKNTSKEEMINRLKTKKSSRRMKFKLFDKMDNNFINIISKEDYKNKNFKENIFNCENSNIKKEHKIKDKCPDLLVFMGSKLLFKIIEIKCTFDTGGSQDRQIDDAMSYAKHDKGLAIIDGYHQINTYLNRNKKLKPNKKVDKKIKEILTNEQIISAYDLEEYLQKHLKGFFTNES